jgi:hypothetical protein
MGKTGKICAPVILVLAIAAVVFAVFLMTTSKKATARAKILAQGLSETAKTLDSGSGESSKATFTPAAGSAKESGTLSWAEFQKGESGYKSAANSVDDLAKQILEQREALIKYLMNISNALEVPANMRPNAENLADLTKYEKGADGVATYARILVKRDQMIKNKLNDFLRQLGVREQYTGKITANGDISPEDIKAFDAARRKFADMRNDKVKYENVLKSVYSTLNAARVDGVSFEQISGADASNADKVADNARRNLQKARTELAKINKLRADVKQRDEVIAKQMAQLEKMQKEIKEANDVIEGFYKQGLGLRYASASTPAKTSYSEVSKELAGKILGIDDTYGFIVVSVCQSDVIKGVKFSVHRGEKHLGFIRIVDTNRYNSIAVIDSGDVKDLQVGDGILIASDVLQDKVEK